MKLPKQALPVQRPATSAVISNQKGIEAANNAFEEILKRRIMSSLLAPSDPTFRTSKCSTKRLRIFLELAIAVPGFGDRILPY